jgi:hypothetical protein
MGLNFQAVTGGRARRPRTDEELMLLQAIHEQFTMQQAIQLQQAPSSCPSAGVAEAMVIKGLHREKWELVLSGRAAGRLDSHSGGARGQGSDIRHPLKAARGQSDESGLP